MKVLTFEDFSTLGQENPVAQQEWCQMRDKELSSFWQCSCGKKLPKTNFVWKNRFQEFCLANRLKAGEIDAGYYCDECATEREYGLE